MQSVQAIRALSVPAAVALAFVTSPAGAADKFFPTFGSNAYDVRHYDIGLDVQVSPHRIKGSARIVIRAEKRLASFSLDLAGLKVTKVEIGGAETPFKQANDKLVVTPASPIAAGRVFTLSVAYGGHPQALDDPTLEEPDPRAKLGWTNWKKVSYVVSEPIGASNWFPVNDQPTDKASYTLSISVEKPYTAVANGVLTAVSGYGKSRLFLWEQKQPMASYLATVHVNKFKLETQKTTDRKPLRYYTTPGTTADDLAALRKTPKMVSFMESYVAPYPFDGYGSVMVDDPRLYYALETQAMSTFSSGYADEATVAHELAHQWFGDSVTVAEWRDLWLAEGFATYFEFLWTYRDDPKGFDGVMGRVYDYIVANKIGPAVVSRPQDIFADNTYYRGSVTLYALRETVGQKTFYKIVKTYYDTYANGNATSQDFIDVAVKVSGNKKVANLLHAWLYEKPVPPLPGRESAARATGPVEAPPLGAGVRRPFVAAEAAR